MAINRRTTYPTQIATATGYPGGKAKNKVSANDTTGTPFEQRWVNDMWGFMDALMGRGQRTRSGEPDSSTNSDHCFALEEIIRYWMMQAFNPAPVLGVPTTHGKFRRSIPIFGYHTDYWRPVTGGRNARLYLYHHQVGIMGSEGDFIRQLVDFPIPRLRLTGIFASFEDAGDARIRIERRARNEHAAEAFTANTVTMNCDDYGGSAIEAYLPVPGTIIHNPDRDNGWEYILTVEPSSANGMRLENIALEYQWIPLDISYDGVLDTRAMAASSGTATWG
jgi:hypothetical protein